MNKIIRIAILAGILAAGAFSVAKTPEAVMSFLPKVDTVTLTATDYCETVSGAGEITAGVYVNVFVGERDIRKVKLGQEADIIGAAFEDGVYTATVCDIDNEAVKKQGEYAYETMVRVTLKIDNPDEDLRSGYTARAEIKTGKTKKVYIIPYNAIGQDDAGEYVYVLAGNKAARRDIVTGAELADGAEVVGGLNPGDEVISHPENVGDSKLVMKRADDNE